MSCRLFWISVCNPLIAGHIQRLSLRERARLDNTMQVCYRVVALSQIPISILPSDQDAIVQPSTFPVLPAAPAAATITVFDGLELFTVPPAVPKLATEVQDRHPDSLQYQERPNVLSPNRSCITNIARSTTPVFPPYTNSYLLQTCMGRTYIKGRPRGFYRISLLVYRELGPVLLPAIVRLARGKETRRT